jgi:hypothetical protein
MEVVVTRKRRTSKRVPTLKQYIEQQRAKFAALRESTDPIPAPVLKALTEMWTAMYYGEQERRFLDVKNARVAALRRSRRV